MNIYLVRHGETEHYRLGYYSNEDEDLNENGIKQAYELKELLKDIPYLVCYCSPLLRAKHTAEIVNEQADRLLIPIEQLTERNPRALNGKPLEFTNRSEYWNYYSAVNYGAESMQELFDRVFNFLDYLKTKVGYTDILIVAHSGVSKAFYAYFNGIPEDGQFLHLGLKNCEVRKYTLETEDGITSDK